MSSLSFVHSGLCYCEVLWAHFECSGCRRVPRQVGYRGSEICPEATGECSAACPFHKTSRPSILLHGSTRLKVRLLCENNLRILNMMSEERACSFGVRTGSGVPQWGLTVVGLGARTQVSAVQNPYILHVREEIFTFGKSQMVSKKAVGCSWASARTMFCEVGGTSLVCFEALCSRTCQVLTGHIQDPIP